MNKRIKQICDTIYKKAKNEPYKWGFFCVFVVVFLIPAVIWGSYFAGDHGIVLIHTSLEVGDALVVYATFLSFIGTVALGYIAIYQNKRITDLNERATLVEEENNFPYLEANFRNVISENLANPTWTNEFVRSKEYVSEGEPTYHFTKYIKGPGTGETIKESVIFFLKNTSKVVITDLEFISLKGYYPFPNGGLKNFTHDQVASFECMNSSAIHPGQKIIVYMDFITDDDGIKSTLLKLPTEFSFLFKVNTLHHSYKQKICFDFAVGMLNQIRYTYDIQDN